jgi:endo-1,4-beta-xylanase
MRWKLLAAVVAVGLVVGGCALRIVASADGLVIGSAARADALANDAQYGSLLAHEFSMLVPENELKWDTTEPQRGIYNFAPADQLVAFANSHKMQVRGTPLVWYLQNPSWLTTGSWTADTLGSVLDNHITNVVGHFVGVAKQWDVVNEAFNDDGTTRSSLWSQTLGTGYIDRAFQDAHAADPDAKLFYNDYNLEWSNPKADAVYSMVASMKQRGVPIDGVGFQMHALAGFPPGADLQQQFARYAAIGVDVAITEMDVRIPVPTTSADLDAQAKTYHDAVAACVASSNCHTVLVWGFTDKYSWIPTFFPGYGAADLYDANFAPKLARTAVENALKHD